MILLNILKRLEKLYVNITLNTTLRKSLIADLKISSISIPEALKYLRKKARKRVISNTAKLCYTKVQLALVLL